MNNVQKKTSSPLASERFFRLGTLKSLKVFSWRGWVPKIFRGILGHLSLQTGLNLYLKSTFFDASNTSIHLAWLGFELNHAEPPLGRWIRTRYSQRSTPPILIGSWCIEKSLQLTPGANREAEKLTYRLMPGPCPMLAARRWSSVKNGPTYLRIFYARPNILWYSRDCFRTYVVILYSHVIYGYSGCVAMTSRYILQFVISFHDRLRYHGDVFLQKHCIFLSLPRMNFTQRAAARSTGLEVLGIATKAGSTHRALGCALGHGQTAQ